VPVDVDDLSTWPPALTAWLRPLADSSEATDAIAISLIEREPRLLDLLAGRKLLAYHCTRLLPSEVAAVRANGLRALTAALVEERLRRAAREGAITEAEATRLAGTSVYALGEQEHREGRVCAILGRSVLDDHPAGAEPLLSAWGGEAIYWKPYDDEPVLRRIGQPAIVRMQLDPARIWAFSLAAPFLAALRGEGADADIQYLRDVPAADVLDIWQPGQPGYDRHRDLPQR
jgi:hypothetical protein